MSSNYNLFAITYFTLSIITIIILYSIWQFYVYKLEGLPSEREGHNATGKGILYILFSVVCSAIWGGANIYESSRGFFSYSIIVNSILDTFSNVFLLLSISYLNKEFTSKHFSQKNWIKLVLLSGLTIIIIRLFTNITNALFLLTVFEYIFTSLTLLGVGYVFYIEFKDYGLKNIGWLTIIIIIAKITLIWISIVKPTGIENSFVFVTSLITEIYLYLIFVALSFSWLSDKSKKLIPLTFVKKEFTREKVTQKTNDQKGLNSNLKRELKGLIGQNEIKRVIEDLADFFRKSKLDEALNMIIVQSSNLYELNAKSVLGTISHENYQLERAKIINNILFIIDEKIEDSS